MIKHEMPTEENLKEREQEMIQKIKDLIVNKMELEQYIASTDNYNQTLVGKAREHSQVVGELDDLAKRHRAIVHNIDNKEAEQIS